MSVPLLLLLQWWRRNDLQIGTLFGEIRGPFLQVLVTRSIIGSALLVIGFTMTSALKSILLLRLEALFVLIWSVLLRKERATIGKIGLVLALILGSVLVVMPPGMLAVGLSGNQAPNLGDVLIVTALLFFSYSYLPTETVVAKVSPTNVNITANTIGGITILLLALFVNHGQVFNLPPQAWSLIFAYACLFSVVGINLYYFAFKTIKPWIIACFLSLEVVYGVPLAWAIHHEQLSLWQALGALMVVAATTGIGLLNAREQARS